MAESERKSFLLLMGNIIGYVALLGSTIWVLRAFIIIALQGYIMAYETNSLVLGFEIFMMCCILVFGIFRVLQYLKNKLKEFY
ncbi:MAG: hypothetical protein GF311_14965 [Candidatus Lokiarchaeota archaeon]|nr:hypothetical protein [Candidatus Lokiarchaeota archaeon]